MSPASGSETFRIEISGQGSFDCSADDSVLRAALRAGFPLPYSCGSGTCGECRFTLISGNVVHQRKDPPAWTGRDVKRKRWLGCQALPVGDCVIDIRVSPSGVPIAPERKRAELVAVAELTHDMREFVFRIDGSDHFLPGQYALFQLPTTDWHRAYSMANLPGAGDWRFHIKQVDDGQATNFLFHDIAPGDSIVLDGPFGNAYLRESTKSTLLLLAGGSGMAPILSIARAAAKSSPSSWHRIHVVYGGRRGEDIYGGELLAEEPAFGDRLTFTPVVSTDDPDWPGHRGFVHQTLGRLFRDELQDAEVYVAGPPPMIAAVNLELQELGVSHDVVHFDEFA